MLNHFLNPTSFAYALSELAANDQDLKGVLDRFGAPPMWSREPGFPTLVYIVLEQQVSLASARAAYDRLCKFLPDFTPTNFLKLDRMTLKTIGFSRQKITYCRNIAVDILSKILPIDRFAYMPDDQIRVALQRIKGIGPWTTEIYLLMALNRPDVWPVGDLALVSAIQRVKNLPERPTSEEFIQLGEPWKPWRSVAARILWHYYLSS